VIEHPRRRFEQRLRDGERAGGVAREQDTLGQLGGRLKMIGSDVVLKRQERGAEGSGRDYSARMAPLSSGGGQDARAS